MSTCPRRRRFLRRAALLAIAAILVANLLAYLHARAMTRFVAAGERTPPPEQLTVGGKLKALLLGVRIPRPVNARTPADVGLASETHTFQGEAGTLEAWAIGHAAPRGLVLVFHGYAGSKAQVLTTARRLHDLGWSVALVDFRGSGGSQGDRTSIGWHEANDVAAAVRWASEALGEHAPVLYGFSMGAAAVLRATAVLHLAPRGIIIEATFDRMVTTVRHRFAMMHVPAFPMAELLVFWGGVQNGFDAFAHNPIDYAARVTCPALVLQGGRDERVTRAEAESVVAALRGRKTLHVFPAAGHDAGTEADDVEWATVVAPFLASL